MQTIPETAQSQVVEVMKNKLYVDKEVEALQNKLGNALKRRVQRMIQKDQLKVIKQEASEIEHQKKV